MNSIFPISELAVMALFALGLIWLVVEVVRQDPEALAVVRRRSEPATAYRRRVEDGAQNRFQSSSIC